MIDPRRVAFDIDGVIANTMQLFIDIAREVYGITTVRYENITRYDLNTCLDIGPEIISEIVQRITEGNYPCSLKPIPGAERVLNRLRTFGPILLVTARPMLGPIRAWVEQMLGATPSDIEVIATGGFEAKTDVLLQRDVAFFVDDRLDTCFLLQQHDITPLVYVQPWNRQNHPFLDVDGWRQLEMLIDWERGSEHRGLATSTELVSGQ
jgi:5'(3')-deoxyribonucleotidase